MSRPTLDDSGFEVTFEDDTPDSERKFYLKAFPSVEMVKKARIHCTACNNHIGTAPVSESKIRMHPILRVTQCRGCATFYNSGEFEKGEDGSELYCRWCGQGGEVYCCSNCPFVFCKKCIITNLSKATVQDIERTDNWACFACSPQILFKLRAQHWALTNFISKQIKEIVSSALSEEEVDSRMKIDQTTCCPNKNRSKVAMVTGPKPKEKSRKRSASPMEHSSRTKWSKILPASQILNGGPAVTLPDRPETAHMTAPTTSNDLICTPDISNFMNEDIPDVRRVPTAIRQKAPVVTSPSVRQFRSVTPANMSGVRVRHPSVRNSAPNLSSTPMVLNQQSVMQQVRYNVPVFHTINGFRIDLNTAAQQDTFRLPNGKLIQVKKQIPQNQAAAQNFQRPQNVPIRPTMQQPMVVSQPQIPQVTLRFSSANGQQMLNGVRPMQMQVQARPPVGLPLRPQVPIMQKPNHPPTVLGKAQNNFEMKVYGSLELGHQIINKINILTNQPSYKSVRNFKDLKELYIHLSYLLTYAQGRFKSLHEKCMDELKALGFEDAKEDAKDNADGDVEVIDNPAPLIELDSDDEREPIPPPIVELGEGPPSPPPLVNIHRVPLRKVPFQDTLTIASVVSMAQVESPGKSDTSVLDRDDPKLHMKAQVALMRVEHIRPEIIEVLKRIKDEQKERLHSGEVEVISDDEEKSCTETPVKEPVEVKETDQKVVASEVATSSSTTTAGEENLATSQDKTLEAVESSQDKSSEAVEIPNDKSSEAVDSSQDKSSEAVETSEAVESSQDKTSEAVERSQEKTSEAAETSVTVEKVTDSVTTSSSTETEKAPEENKTVTTSSSSKDSNEIMQAPSTSEDTSTKSSKTKEQDDQVSSASPKAIATVEEDLELTEDRLQTAPTSSTRDVEKEEVHFDSPAEIVSLDSDDEDVEIVDSSEANGSSETGKVVADSSSEKMDVDPEDNEVASSSTQEKAENHVESSVHEISSETLDSEDESSKNAQVESSEKVLESQDGVDSSNRHLEKPASEESPASSSEATKSSDEPHQSEASKVEEGVAESSKTETPKSDEVPESSSQQPAQETSEVQPSTSNEAEPSKTSEEKSEITLEDVDVDLFPDATAGTDETSQKSDLNLDELIAESDLVDIAVNFAEDAWNSY